MNSYLSQPKICHLQRVVIIRRGPKQSHHEINTFVTFVITIDCSTVQEGTCTMYVYLPMQLRPGERHFTVISVEQSMAMTKVFHLTWLCIGRWRSWKNIWKQIQWIMTTLWSWQLWVLLRWVHGANLVKYIALFEAMCRLNIGGRKWNWHNI